MKGSGAIIVIAIGLLLLYVGITGRFCCLSAFVGCLFSPAGSGCGGTGSQTVSFGGSSGGSGLGPEIFNFAGDLGGGFGVPDLGGIFLRHQGTQAATVRRQ